MMQFADTFYFLALLNAKDRAHRAALERSTGSDGLLTTEWVLVELANALAPRQKRSAFINLYRILKLNPNVEIVPAHGDLFERGIRHFAERTDKDWSLVGCISFIVMKDRGITEALTGDRHFEQAGFTALLK